MILLVDNVECATLTLHMSIMRKSYRNLIKVRYKARKGDFLNAYDYVLKECKEVFEREVERYELHLNILDAEILKAFLSSYLAKVDAEFSKANIKDKINVLDQEQLKILSVLQVKLETMLAA